MSRTGVTPPQFSRLAIGARIFGLLILSGPVLLSGDDTALLALLAIGLVWAATAAAERLDLNAVLILALDAGLIGAVCALSLDTTLAVLGSLAVPPFTAALRRGAIGVALSVSAETITVVLTSLFAAGVMSASQGTGTFTWLFTGIGLGLIGSFLHSTTPTSIDPLAPYREAQRLLRGLVGLSSDLSSGLDPNSLADSIAEAVRDDLPVAGVAVFVPRDDGLTPLVHDQAAQHDQLSPLEDLALAGVRAHAVIVSGSAFAFPLSSGPEQVAIVAGILSPGLDPARLELDTRLDRLARRLRGPAVQLSTALLFAALRDSATSDERRRLAREIHDGVAQDIASLGYLVDSLAARPASASQAAQLAMLRGRITTVVTEVRRSVQSLRTEAGASPSLGTAIGSIARHLSDSSGIPIQVTADERTVRLRPEVESELLRITQEAMTNAVRHARPSLIEVRCTVAAPRAEIVVIDNGDGLGPGRPDSHGIQIMHERARLIDAELTVENGVRAGTVVNLRLAGGSRGDVSRKRRTGRVSA